MQRCGKAEVLDELRARVARIERRSVTARPGSVLPFGHPGLDKHLPGGGLALGALHEVAGSGLDMEHGAAAALFVAGILARLSGTILWALERRDLFAPALAGAGLHQDRVIYAEAGRSTAVLLVVEEGLRHPGLAGVVGEVSGRLTLAASRRLQLAAEAANVAAFAIRHSRRHDDPALAEPSAAATRWRIAALPSDPPLPQAPETPGLARACWRLDLVRCRGGEARSWTVEACDETGRLGVAADLAHGQAAAASPRHAAAG